MTGSGHVDTAEAKLSEADRIAAQTGERNGFRQHLGPTKVRLCRVAIGVELGQRPAVAERGHARADQPGRTGGE
jgi:hypothetical protein